MRLCCRSWQAIEQPGACLPGVALPRMISHAQGKRHASQAGPTQLPSAMSRRTSASVEGRPEAAFRSLGSHEVQGSRLMRNVVDSDSALLLGGDLLVSVQEVRCPPALCGNASSALHWLPGKPVS